MISFNFLFKSLNKSLKLPIVKAASLSIITTSIKLITNFILIKYIAITVGASGVGLLGQLSNFLNIILPLASGGINNGLTRIISSKQMNPEMIDKAIKTGFSILLVCTSITSIAIFIFSHQLNIFVFYESSYEYIIKTLALTLFFYAINLQLTSIINGHHLYSLVAKINIVNSIFSLVWITFFIYLGGIGNILLGYVTSQTMQLLTTLVFVSRKETLRYNIFPLKYDKRIAGILFLFSVMIVIKFAADYITLILIRRSITLTSSSVNAGLWESLNRLSNIYLLPFFYLIDTYLLPKLGTFRQKQKIEVLNRFIIYVCTAFLILGAGIFVFRDFILRTVFSNDFLFVGNIIGFHIVGDFFYLANFCYLTFLIVSFKTKVYITIKIFYNVLYLLSVSLILQIYSFELVPIAYASANIVELAVLIFVTKSISKHGKAD